MRLGAAQHVHGPPVPYGICHKRRKLTQSRDSLRNKKPLGHFYFVTGEFQKLDEAVNAASCLCGERVRGQFRTKGGGKLLCNGRLSPPLFAVVGRIAAYVEDVRTIELSRNIKELMSNSTSLTGTFNLTDNSTLTPDFANAVSDIFGSTSIAVIALTVVNFFAAFLSILLIVDDNHSAHKTWYITPSRRIPLALALAIMLSHLIFILKAFNGLTAFATSNPPKMKTLACRVLNELGFWGLTRLAAF